MRRLALAPLVLLLAAPVCQAADTESDAAPKKGACVYVRPAATGNASSEGDVPQARPATPPVARSTPRPAASSGGGDAADTVQVRPRGPRWHSFLPGMFR
ncbi:hypothetical protein CSC62_00600 [Pseudoxanthomonas jiangsuensis]|uniref:hypothetical protein n=1 Tax=Pseudoxanthomonas jiangsuensis TaxID=619688 RepID=UPI00139126B3|nr:hypothetical protein [Pseudoxanthomonas jiangsuensis]KAF1699438.1 hypothetical protein CSC62_00600 [Pseudoxanthomonas jiangsuensis]